MTIKEEYKEEFVIKKSRFIICLHRCQTREEAADYIKTIRRQYPDASHVCSAYLLKDGIMHTSDDGEPSGTAGVPILKAIQQNNIENVIACAVRYFGGIKLGASGLIRAYHGCTNDAIQHAPKVVFTEYQMYEVTYPYELSGILESWLRQNTRIISQVYGEEVCIVFASKDPKIGEQIRNLTKGKVDAIPKGIITQEEDCTK